MVIFDALFPENDSPVVHTAEMTDKKDGPFDSHGNLTQLCVSFMTDRFAYLTVSTLSSEKKKRKKKDPPMTHLSRGVKRCVITLKAKLIPWQNGTNDLHLPRVQNIQPLAQKPSCKSTTFFCSFFPLLTCIPWEMPRTGIPQWNMAGSKVGPSSEWMLLGPPDMMMALKKSEKRGMCKQKCTIKII